MGLRTANHGFRFPKGSKWEHWSWQYHGEKKEWEEGFGGLVLGSWFFSHHGWHGHESTRGIVEKGAEKNEILRGIAKGSVWGGTDVYGVKEPIPGDDVQILLRGQVLAGMKVDDPPVGKGPYEKAPDYVTEGSNDKNDPMQALAWTKSYQLPGGRKGRAFATTLGASVDLVEEGTRRLIVNGMFWCLGMEIPPVTDVDLVDEFVPTPFQTHPKAYWEERQLKVSDFDLKTTIYEPSGEPQGEVALPYFDVRGGREGMGYDFAGHPVNRHRLYQFYDRQAEYYLDGHEVPEILPHYPGLDAGTFGHWGKFHKNSYRDRRWNLMESGDAVCGILRVNGQTYTRAIAVRLNGELSCAFDAETLRFTHVWKGGFLKYSPSRWGIGNGIEPDGEIILESPQQVGLSVDGQWPQAFPEGEARFEGFFRTAPGIVFRYQIGGFEILDTVSAQAANGTLLTRSLKVTGGPSDLSVLAFGMKAEAVDESEDDQWSFASFAGKDGTVGGLVGINREEIDGELDLIPFGKGNLEAHFSNLSSSRIDIRTWIGSTSRDEAGKAIRNQPLPEDLFRVNEGGPARYADKSITLSGHPGDRIAGSPFAIDRIPVPYQNEFGAVMLMGGHDFFANGDAAVCTMFGDVWRVSGLDYGLEAVTWTRIATGLNQALGLSIFDDEIYVVGRDRISRLRDLNGDGEIDFYENFCDDFPSSDGGHDFYTGLQRDGNGYFYFAAANSGVIRVAPDGSSSEIIANGLRNTNGVGASPDGSIVTTSTNEGDWTPASAVFEVKDGDFYGRYFEKDGPEIAPAMCYLPRGLDNSSGGQVFCSSEDWGSLKGQLFHFSFGAGTWMMILRDTADGKRTQGAAVPLPGDFESGVHRGRFHPLDGQLYVTGADGWGNYAITEGDFARVRYVDDDNRLPVGWQAHRNGIVIEFAEPVDPASLKASNFFAQAWNYEYADAYGSLEYSLKLPEMPGHDPVPVSSVHPIGNEGKKIFIEMPTLQPAMQMQVHGRLISGDGEAFKLDLYPTVLWLRDDFTAFPGYQRNSADKPSELTLRIQFPFPFHPKHPPGKPGRKMAVTAISGLQYDVKEIHAKPGEAITIEFRNLDSIPHNFVIAGVGKLPEVGNAANLMLANPKAAEQHYVPDSDDVLHYTPMLNHNRRYSLNITAPETPGEYPFLCTYPGHWAVMNGVLVVGEGSGK